MRPPSSPSTNVRTMVSPRPVAAATGLGLTIVRTFVEGELGGRIRLDRVDNGSGTVAEVWVPGSRLVGPGGDARDPAT